MKRLVFATENPAKLAEIRKFARKFDVEVLSPSEAGLAPVSVEELGETYEENARLKVEAYLDQPIPDDVVLCGDDSGIEITALGGEPGLHTRRWLGYSMSDDEIVGYALGRLHDIKDRTAVFKSTLAYTIAGGAVQFVTGELKGSIATLPLAGQVHQEGYPFRRLFVVDGNLPIGQSDQMSTENSSEDRYSHREKAFKALFERIKEVTDG